MNTDYTLEGGASRNFEAAKTAEMLAQKAQKEIEEEELNNPMKVREKILSIFVCVVLRCLLYKLTIKADLRSGCTLLECIYLNICSIIKRCGNVFLLIDMD